MVSTGRKTLMPLPSASVKRSVVLATVDTTDTASSEKPAVTRRISVFTRA